MEIFGFEFKRPDWMRGPKKANIANVSIGKLQDRHDTAGVEIDVVDVNRDTGVVEAKITKIAVKGDQ